tara:strand:+ start:3855 stop:4256 length:402 start_codon:yes stop_codon:yes gene_type:complete
LGHLIHQADNFRGSFRGTGFELRTDAYGAVRGERGVLLSTYGIQPNHPPATSPPPRRYSNRPTSSVPAIARSRVRIRRLPWRRIWAQPKPINRQSTPIIRGGHREYNEERPKKELSGLTPADYAGQMAAEAAI